MVQACDNICFQVTTCSRHSFCEESYHLWLKSLDNSGIFMGWKLSKDGACSTDMHPFMHIHMHVAYTSQITSIRLNWPYAPGLKDCRPNLDLNIESIYFSSRLARLEHIISLAQALSDPDPNKARQSLNSCLNLTQKILVIYVFSPWSSYLTFLLFVQPI